MGWLGSSSAGPKWARSAGRLAGCWDSREGEEGETCPSVFQPGLLQGTAVSEQRFKGKKLEPTRPLRSSLNKLYAAPPCCHALGKASCKSKPGSRVEDLEATLLQGMHVLGGEAAAVPPQSTYSLPHSLPPFISRF